MQAQQSENKLYFPLTFVSFFFIRERLSGTRSACVRACVRLNPGEAKISTVATPRLPPWDVISSLISLGLY